MYDFSWHERHGEKTQASAHAVLSIVTEIYTPKSVIDIGCGSGIWLREAKRLGFSETKGVDGPWTDLDHLCIPPNEVTICDLEHRLNLNRQFDAALCLEVAEHVSQASANLIVENLTSLSDVVIFGAAIPYQGGFRHINERWQSWWAAKFANHGYQYFDVLRPQIWHNPDVHFWYKQNTLVYVRHDRADLIKIYKDYIANRSLGSYPLDLVHPERYEALASYKQIAFKPLLRELPAAVAKRATGMLLGRR